MKRLIMVRHGETDFNRAHCLQGQLDTPLNNAGEQQATRVAQALRSEHIDAIWCSPLQRAYKTAERINQHHDKPMTVVTGLIERSFGAMEGMPVATIRQREADHVGSLYHFQIPDGESFAQLEQRAQRLVDKALGSSVETLMLVGHAGIFRAIIAALLGWDFDRWFGIAQHNTCINTFNFQDGHVVAYQLNDHAHLQG